MSLITSLYAEIEPYSSGHLKVSEIHEIYYEELGNPQGIPLIFIHGGPGAPPRWVNRQMYDPAAYRIIMYHQRGCGRSRPEGELRENTIDAAVSDICALRKHLGINQPWVVVGNSWGTALGQIYAIKHPDHIAELVLVAVTFADQKGAHDFLQDGYASKVRPEKFADYVNHIPADEVAEHGCLVNAYCARILGDDEAKAVAACQAQMLWNFSILVLNQEEAAIEKAKRDPRTFLTLSRLFSHFYLNEYSPESRSHIWPYLDVLRGLPKVHLIHGRYDLIAAPVNAYQLHQELPNSELHIVPRSGHFALEPEMAQTVINVTDDIARRLGS